MKKVFTLKLRNLIFFLLLQFFSFYSLGQTTLNTTAVSGFSNNNGSGTVTFNLQNTNPYDIIITHVEGIVGTTGVSSADIWFKTTPVNGAPGQISVANGWTLGATGTFNGTANTTQTNLTTEPFLSNISVTIPAGATYGIAVSAYSGTTGRQRYHTMVSPSIPLTTVSEGGVNIFLGNNISYAGGAPPTAPTNHPRAWLGKLTFVPALPCTDPPAAGNIVSSANPVCPSSNFILSIQGGTSGTGQSYQWQSAPSSSGPWTNLGTISSQTISQSSNTWYQCIVTCGNNSVTLVPVLITTNSFIFCYCPATHTNGCAGHITNVSINTLNNTSICNIPAIQYPASGSTTTTLLKNVTYDLSISISSNSTLSKSAWFDWNANGIFEVTEHFQLAGTSTATTPPIAAAGSTTIISVPVPATAASGQIGMRIRTRGSGSVNGPGDACTSFGGGESEDYIITIAEPSGDITPPVLSNATINIPADLCDPTPRVITIDAQDASGLASVAIEWSVNNVVQPDISMTLISGTVNNGTWSATIPAQIGAVSYSFLGTDAGPFNMTNTLPGGIYHDGATTPPLVVTPLSSTICLGESVQLQAFVSASGLLVTPLTDNNGSAAVGFDLKNKSALPITLNYISYRSNSSAGTNHAVTVYYKTVPLNCVMPINPSTLSWITIGTATAIAAGPAPALTQIPLNLNLTIPPGQTYAIAISGPASSIRYITGIGGCPVVAGDNYLEIYEGFGGTFTSANANRNFTGSISYSFGDPNTNVVWSPSTYLDNPTISNPIATPAVGIHNYTATATATSGCTSSATVVINVPGAADPAPSTVGTTICEGAIGTLSASGLSTLNWYTDETGGTVVHTGSAWTTTWFTTTTYWVESFNGVCASARTAVTVTIIPVAPLTVTAVPNNICEGQTSQLNATSFVSGLLSMPPEGTTFSPNVRGYYFIAPVDFVITGLKDLGTGTGLQSVAVVKFVPSVPPPVFGATTEDFVTLYLSQNNTNLGMIPVNIPIQAGDVIGILSQRGTVTSYSDPAGPHTTDIAGHPVTLTRMGMQFPLGTNVPQSLFTSSGAIGRTQFEWSIGDPSVNFSWTPTNTLNNSLIANPIASPSLGTTNYTVTATEGSGCTSSASVNVTVYPIPPAPIASALNQVCGYGQVTLNATGTGNPGSVIRWYDVSSGGTPIGTGNSIVVTISATTTFYATEYDGSLCEGPRASVQAISTPAPAPVTLTSSATALCDGSITPVTLNATSTHQGYSYTFEPTTGMNPADGIGSSVSVLPATTTVYTAYAADGGCVATSTITVGVGNTPILNSVTSTLNSLCTGDQTTLNVSANLPGLSTIQNGFDGLFAPGTWTFSNIPSTVGGSVNTSGAPSSITIFSGNSLIAGVSRYEHPVLADGNITFDWSYSTADDPFYDYPQYSINGVSTILPGYSTTGAFTQNGTAIIPVIAGQTFALEMNTVDGDLGAGQVTITNISFPLAAGSATINYTWSPAADLNQTTGNTVVASPTSSGTKIYSVTASNEGCSVTGTVTFSVSQTPSAPSVSNTIRCGLGPVTVGATGTGTLRWVKDPTGGEVYNIGNSAYTTSINNTTDFYVFDDPNSITTNFGPIDPYSTGTTGSAFYIGNWELFNVLSPGGVILENVDVFFTGAVGSQYVILIEDNTGQPLDTITGITTVTGGAVQTVPIGTWLPAGNGYRIRFALNPGSTWISAGASGYPYTIPGQISWTGNNYTTTSRFFFYNWQIRTGCFGPLATVTATVDPAPPLTITPSGATTYCGSGSVMLTATNTSYVSHTWSPVTGLTFTPNGYVVIASPTETTTYTVTATDGLPNGCVAEESITVTVNSLPSVSISPVTPDPTCVNTIINLSSVAASSSVKQIGFDQDYGQVQIGVYNGANVSSKVMMLLTAAELNTSGIFGPTAINSAAFEVALKGSTAPYNNFTIKMGGTGLTALTTSYPASSMTTVYTNNYTSALGWNTHPFDTPFLWDGTSNVLVEICFTNTTTSVFDFVFVTPTSFNSYLFTNGGPCTSTTGVVSVNRPNIRLTGGEVQYTWTPITGLSSTTVPNPSVSFSNPGMYSYTATVTDPANGCSASETININISDTPTIPVATITGDNDFCFSGSTTLEMTGSTGDIQWQSSLNNSIWNNIPGATSAVYNTGTVTTSTYYRVITSCGNSSTSSAVLVNINNPQITSKTDGTRCGYGSVSLSATASNGATINWYDSPAGSAPIGSGTTFNTPNINSTQNFYVAASLGGSTFNVAHPGPTSLLYTNLTNYGFQFTLTQPIVLNTVMMISGTGTSATVALYNSNGSTQLYSTTVTASPGDTVNVPINMSLQPGTYRIIAIAFTGTWARQNGSASITYPYQLQGNIGQIDGYLASTITGSISTSDNFYYFFYNWSVSTGCEGPRESITANVQPAPAFTLSANTSICGNETTNLQVLDGLQEYTNFEWSPADGLNNTTGSSVVANPSTTTTYTVVASGNSQNCQNIATVTVEVKDTPIPNASISTNSICEGTAVTISASTTPSISQIGTGTSTSSTYGPIHRASSTSTVHYSRASYRFTAAELAAEGVVSGLPITTLAWNKANAFTFSGSNNGTFEIYLKNSASVTPYVSSTPWSTYNTGATLVATFNLSDVNFPATTGWVPFNVNPFIYTGGDLEVQVTWAMTTPATSPFSGGSFLWQYTSGLPAGITGYANSSAVQSGSTTLTVTTIRPNIQFTQVIESASWSGTGITAAPLIQTFIPTTGNNKYYYTVTNNVTNCVVTDSVEVYVDPLPIPVISSSQSMPLCEGASTTLSTQYLAADGYTFSWNGGLFTSENITVNLPGIYDCVVTSPNGCTSTITTFTIEIATIFADIAGTTPVLCNGDSTGTVTIDALGTLYDPSGVVTFGPYVFSLNGGNYQSSPTLTGLWAGSHNVSVYDSASGCAVNIAVLITEPAPLVAGPVTLNNNVTCNGLSTGSATASASGGVGPYNYSWNTPIPKQGAQNDEMPAGTWTVTIMDNNGCTTTASVTITQPDPLVATIASQTNVGCYGGTDGSVTISATGGTLPYNGDGVYSGLSEGTYNYIVTDANGCATSITAVITEPIEVTVSAISTNVSCHGLADGTITVNAPQGATVTVNGQPLSSSYGPGVYTVVASVPDGNANGFCTASTTVSISQPIQVTVTANTTDVTCNGFANGTITATASIGANISVNGQPYNANTLYGPGTYTIVAIADNGNNNGVCTASTNVTIAEPSLLTVNTTFGNSTYWNANNGTATAIATGGNGGYMYLWSTGSTATTISGLAPGSYTVTVTDSKGCTVSATVTISEPAFICSGSSTHIKWGQGGWGGTPNGINPATYLYANFAIAFPNGLTIGHPIGTPNGCNRSMKWNTPQAITAFLPSTGTPRQLNTGHSTNFTAIQYGNTLAAQVVALTINVVFDAYDPNFSSAATVTFGDMIICINGNNTQFNGWTVKQLLTEANRVLACGGNKNYISALTSAIDAVNNNNNATCCPSSPTVRTVTNISLPLTGEARLNVYPNPTQAKVTVLFESENEMPTEITLMDMRGRVVAKITGDLNHTFTREIDLSHLDNGLYMLIISNNGNIIKSSKVSKVN